MSEPVYTLEKVNDVLHVTFRAGQIVSPQQIMEAIEFKNKHYDVLRHNTLWDFRGCQASEKFGYKEMKQIIRYIDMHSGAKWNPRIAILVEADVQFGLSRMFQTLVEGFPTEVAIFYLQEEAEAWVGLLV